MNLENLPLLVILALSVLGNNNSVAIASGLLLLVKLIGFESYFPLIESHGLQFGIILITMAVLIPIAKGSVTFNDMTAVFKNPMGIVALLIGVIVAWMAGRGLPFMTTSPEVVMPLIIGTVIGVAFFQGLAVGPLIASGIVWFFLSIIQAFK
jgi:uncharacterized membrane protein (DUF441 family)